MRELRHRLLVGAERLVDGAPPRGAPRSPPDALRLLEVEGELAGVARPGEPRPSRSRSAITAVALAARRAQLGLVGDLADEVVAEADGVLAPTGRRDPPRRGSRAWPETPVGQPATRAGAGRGRRRGRSSPRSGRAARSTPGSTSRASSGSRSAAGTRLPGACSALRAVAPCARRRAPSRCARAPRGRAGRRRCARSARAAGLARATRPLRCRAASAPRSSSRQRLEREARERVVAATARRSRGAPRARAAGPGTASASSTEISSSVDSSAQCRSSTSSITGPSARGRVRCRRAAACSAIVRSLLGVDVRRRRDRVGGDRERVRQHGQVGRASLAARRRRGCRRRRRGARAAWRAAARRRHRAPTPQISRSSGPKRMQARRPVIARAAAGEQRASSWRAHSRTRRDLPIPAGAVTSSAPRSVRASRGGGPPQLAHDRQLGARGSVNGVCGAAAPSGVARALADDGEQLDRARHAAQRPPARAARTRSSRARARASCR